MPDALCETDLLSFRMIGRSYQWAGFDVGESEGEGDCAQFAELIRAVKAFYPQVLFARLQILPEGRM